MIKIRTAPPSPIDQNFEPGHTTLNVRTGERVVAGQLIDDHGALLVKHSNKFERHRAARRFRYHRRRGDQAFCRDGLLGNFNVKSLTIV